ncbi:hypothetical protein M5K25_001417 [Dendrobium thyrsiflorum]|uniref:Uncharacterized protein n=1 Tax=Dendrobium thyrsiflorum TaxID=117978 RepID=A0ABD0VQF9_DENTH
MEVVGVEENVVPDDVNPSLEVVTPVLEVNQGNFYLEPNQLAIIPSVESPPNDALVVVEEEGNVNVQDAFVSLNPIPIASESLADIGMDVASIDVGNSDANNVVNVETTHVSCSVVDSLKLDVCDVNKVILNESSASLDSPLTSFEPVLSLIIDVPKDKSAFVDIPISIMSDEDLKAHLATSLNISSLDQVDWLDDSLTPICRGADDNFGEHGYESHDGMRCLLVI